MYKIQGNINSKYCKLSNTKKYFSKLCSCNTISPYRSNSNKNQTGNNKIELFCQDINHVYDTWQWHWDYKPQILMTNLGVITELAGVKVFSLLFVIYVKV